MSIARELVSLHMAGEEPFELVEAYLEQAHPLTEMSDKWKDRAKGAGAAAGVLAVAKGTHEFIKGRQAMQREKKRRERFERIGRKASGAPEDDE